WIEPCGLEAGTASRTAGDAMSGGEDAVAALDECAGAARGAGHQSNGPDGSRSFQDVDLHTGTVELLLDHGRLRLVLDLERTASRRHGESRTYQCSDSCKFCHSRRTLSGKPLSFRKRRSQRQTNTLASARGLAGDLLGCAAPNPAADAPRR